jgi:hypothetical protein
MLALFACEVPIILAFVWAQEPQASTHLYF